jgi:hypothetical protein
MSEFPAKYEKKLPDGFTDTVASMSVDEIKKKILESEGHIYEVENAKDDDNDLVKAKEEVKQISEPYKEAKSTETAKIKYCLYILESRGASV